MSPTSSALLAEFSRAKQLIHGLSTNLSLMLMTKEKVASFEAAASGNPLITSLCNELHTRFSKIMRPEDYEAMSQAYETYAELLASTTLISRGVTLDRTPQTGTHGEKRPDFVHHHQRGPIYFEVKALEIADKYERYREMAQRGLEAAADLSHRAKQKGVHFSEQSVSGHRETAPMDERIDQVIKRLRNVIKPGQITYGPTVLVVDMGRLPGETHEPSGLLPVFFNDGPPAESCVSGEFWQVALGCIGERIFTLPEGHGKSNLGGHQAERGVLFDYPVLLAIMFQVCRWNDPSRLFTIWCPGWDRSRLETECLIDDHEIEELLYASSDAMNDSSNALGWKYRTSPPRVSKSSPTS